MTTEEKKEVISTVQTIVTTIEDSEQWWMDLPGRGGFDLDKIRITLEILKREYGT